MTYTCESCGQQWSRKTPPVEDEVLYQRGYWWHRRCAKILRGGLVGFPSSGKLLPSTILVGKARE